MPPSNPALLATPEPPLVTTGDAKVDAYRDRLIRDSGASWRPYLVRLLAGIRADPAIVANFDRLGAVDTPREYVAHYVTRDRIRRGRQLYRLGVGRAAPGTMPAELRLALWGMMADYGARLPRRDALQALLVLGAYGRGGAQYEFELHHAAIHILNGAVPRARLLAYDTGKLGQAQLSAARYPAWAKDGDGDGRSDIWTRRADILATFSGDWTTYAGIPVAVAVRVPRFDPSRPAEARMIHALDASPNVPPAILKRWDGRPWTPALTGQGGTYLEPYGKSGPAFIMLRPAWPVNSRDPVKPLYSGDDKEMGFALAASLLADAIAGRPLPPLQ